MWIDTDYGNDKAEKGSGKINLLAILKKICENRMGWNGRGSVKKRGLCVQAEENELFLPGKSHLFHSRGTGKRPENPWKSGLSTFPRVLLFLLK